MLVGCQSSLYQNVCVGTNLTEDALYSTENSLSTLRARLGPQSDLANVGEAAEVTQGALREALNERNAQLGATAAELRECQAELGRVKVNSRKRPLYDKLVSSVSTWSTQVQYSIPA